ncbi:MAG: hypothetical protein WBC06_07005 [Chitinophagaceae bacterium]
MKKIFFGMAFILSGTVLVNAQNKAVYGEIGGNGVVFSANYDMRFTKTENGFGFRVGVGFAGGTGSSIFTFPLGLNYLTGKGASHLEIGFGVTPITASVELFDDENETGSTTLIMPTVGYRYGKVGKGFVGRIYVGPVIVGGGFFFPFGGISAGIKF